MSQIDQIKSYYRKKESRFGYKVVLAGTRHFGYWSDPEARLTMSSAQTAMEDLLGTTLDLPNGSRVLDAGCGEGRVARRLASNFGLSVTGVDILSESIHDAKRLSESEPHLDLAFEVADYARTRFEANTFDAIYTMETLVHAPDHHKALQEFRRVLRPGGKLVCFEYSVPAVDTMSKKCRRSFEEIAADSAMHSYPRFVDNALERDLASAGFIDTSYREITEHMMPMVRRLARIGAAPYQIAKFLGRTRREVNLRAAVEGWECREYFNYVIVTGELQDSSE